jgi:sugar lactone lactonase YvrE
MAGDVVCAVAEPALLGESPLWHPDEQRLYYCDIAGRELRRHDPATGRLERWRFDSEVACCAPLHGGGLLLALRSGLWRFDPASGARELIAAPPYDPADERYNDGKADPAGRMWCGTLYEPRTAPRAALYCLAHGELTRRADGATVANGLAWSPDSRAMFWADTTSHTIWRFDFDPRAGELSQRRVFARFAPRAEGQPIEEYGGRPDGAAVDVRGHLWVAMYEGQRLVEFAPDATLVAEHRLPVRCPTMPTFGGADLRTLYITTARHRRPADEVASQPWAGAVLAMRVDAPGLPANFADLG